MPFRGDTVSPHVCLYGIIKPLLLQWCIDSWNKMEAGREYIKMGWHTCCTSLFNVHDADKRAVALEEVAKGTLDAIFVPARGGGARCNSGVSV